MFSAIFASRGSRQVLLLPLQFSFTQQRFFSRILLPNIPPSEAKEFGVKWDETNFVYYVEQDQMVEALHRFVTVKSPAGNYRDTKTKLNVPFAEREQVKAKNAKFDSETLSWYAPAGVDLNDFNPWLKEPQKVYLEVPFAEKDEVKQLGAQFDRQVYKWYFDASRQNKSQFAKWSLAQLDAQGSVVPPPPKVPFGTDHQKHHLNVPFDEKDEAKALGAMFDATCKLWYFDEKRHARDRFSKWQDADPNKPRERASSPNGGGYPVVEEKNRVYLDVPFDDKDEAKALGCKFDPARRKWYFDRTKFTKEKFPKWSFVSDDF